MRSSNPVFSSLTTAARPQQQTTNPYGAPAGTYSPYGRGTGVGQPSPTLSPSSRALTVDDVITKTAIVIGIIVVGAIVNFFLSLSNPGMGMMLTGVGAIGGLITVVVSTMGRKFGSAVVTCIYAVFEGLFVGGISFLFAGIRVGGSQGFSLIVEAVIGTIGVFIGMLYVYKSGAVKVTNRFRRMMTGALIGVVILALANMGLGIFFHISPLTNGGPLAIIFSLVCIGLAASSFLMDFDQADRLVRAGAPANYAWGVALGLAVTLVWLYTEILRLLSYFRN